MTHGNDTTQRTVKRINAAGPIITAKINLCIISINLLRASILDPGSSEDELSLRGLIYIYIGQCFEIRDLLNRKIRLSIIYRKTICYFGFAMPSFAQTKKGSSPWMQNLRLPIVWLDNNYCGSVYARSIRLIIIVDK